MTLPPRKIVDDAGFELTPAELALLDDPADPAARVSDAKAARLLASAVIRTAELQWTPELVRIRLREAVRGVEKIVGRVGPSEKTGFWPQHVIEFSDRVGLTEKQLREISNARNRYACGLDEIEVGRIEEAIRWPARYLAADDLVPERMALQTWLWCEVRNEAFERFGAALCGSRRTAFRRRDRATQIILDGLLRDGALP